MTDFFNKIKNSCLGQKCCFLCRPAGDDAEAAVMPVSRLMFGPFGIFADNLKIFCSLGRFLLFLVCLDAVMRFQRGLRGGGGKIFAALHG